MSPLQVSSMVSIIFCTHPKQGTKTEEITVSSSDNVYHLRLKIFETMGIAPGEQRLFFGDVELKNHTHTVCVIGLDQPPVP